MSNDHSADNNTVSPLQPPDETAIYKFSERRLNEAQRNTAHSADTGNGPAVTLPQPDDTAPYKNGVRGSTGEGKHAA